MKLQFDPNQSYQLEAIQSVVELFDGQPIDTGEYAFSMDEGASGVLMSENGIGNNLVLEDEQILANLRGVQERNSIEQSEELSGFHFSIEMETGTGKTYIYLRTIYELNKLYGFTKFVIVVPSIAIRDGVLKNLEITQEHFETLYSRKPATFGVYDSSRVSSLRRFAASINIQILVINIDSFAKDENIINRPNDKLSGKNPIEFIQATRPIVIVDEPQRMETKKRKQAIANLIPLCTLRYSATHLELYNKVYSLNPVQAYDLGLVKQIEVDSVVAEDSFNEAFIRIEEFRSTKTRTGVRLTIDLNTDKGVKRKIVTAKIGDDLYKLSNQREIYRDGYIINAIDITDESIDLSNGERIYIGQPVGALTDDIMKMQMRRMIDEHFKKTKRYAADGIKVLSLVFIDRVAHYRGYDDQGQPVAGKFAQWFEEMFKEYAALPTNKGLIPYEVEAIHDGYFSQDRQGRFKDTKTGKAKADGDAYELIMKDKERLLDINTPLRFIFSHSALREGWDNPNVFQICTLNETHSEMKKRQEIGRGMRLCVNQRGQRVFGRQYNRLTILANESYEDFAKQLQTEIEEETGAKFEGRIKNKRDRKKITLRKGYHLDGNFLDLWKKIKQKTTYQVNYDTEDLVEKAAKAIKEMPPTQQPRIRAERTRMLMTERGIEGQYAGGQVETAEGLVPEIPDVIGYIQSRTNLTRKTILTILKQSARLPDVLINPQLFLDQAVHHISVILQNIMVDGIKYQTIAGVEYDMLLFEAKEIESYIENMYVVTQPGKTIVDHIIYDSDVEEQFARDCENADQVEFFIKLPDWFVIQTPIGTYNPDWALIFKNDIRLYFVAETKSESEGATENLRRNELLKIECGKVHFAEFEEVEYKQVQRLSELI
ncbi:type III restriction enzyme [Candidatus Methanophagaceae archaeon]|nr:type III restriction enzyme [Methanophagales archaeon]